MTRRSNVLARKPRPTTKSYRAAVKQIVLNLQAEHGLNDPELAERLGCSSGTVKNARTEQTNLDGVTLANIEYEFGPSALDPFLDLGGSRAVPTGSICDTDANVCLALLDALHVIIETQHPNSEGGAETKPAEAAKIVGKLRAARRSLDALIALADSAVVLAA
jgi:hypothetical protein